MSDLNFNYSTLKGVSSSKLSEYAQPTNTANSKSDDLELNKSIFQSYFESLKEKSDDQTKKLIQSMQNIPASQVSKLFGNLQTTSVDGVNKLFEDLRVKSADELSELMETLKQKETEKTDDKEESENYLQKYIKKTTEKLSAENNALNQNSVQVSESVNKLETAFEPDEETGEIDTEKAYETANNFVNSYNSFAESINGSKNSTVASKAGFVNDMLGAYGRRLEKVGISADEDGKLSIDREKFEASSERDRERVFGKEDSFASFIDGQAKQLAAYAQTDLYQRSSAYTDAGNITQVSNISGSYFNMLG